MNCFYFLAVTNNGVINIPVKHSCVFISLGCSWEWNGWDMLYPYLTLWGTVKLFLNLSLYTFLATVYEARNLSPCLPTLCLAFSHLSRLQEYIWFINSSSIYGGEIVFPLFFPWCSELSPGPCLRSSWTVDFCTFSFGVLSRDLTVDSLNVYTQLLHLGL